MPTTILSAVDPTYPAYPIAAFIAFALVIVPLPWHLQSWNAGTCLYMIWIGLGCLNYAINAIIWRGNALDAPIWCDISVRFMVGLSVALPATSLCINRRLYKIATVQAVTTSRSDKIRALMVDISIGFGIPLLQMILQIIVAGHRYNVLEDVGCNPTFYNTPVAYPVFLVWAPILSLTSAGYAFLTLRSFMRRRATFNEFLSSTTSITLNRYFRLMSLATSEIFITLPLSLFILHQNATANELHPWISWADTHLDYWRPDLLPGFQWRTKSNVITIEFSRWAVVACALGFFGFFGFADEARRNYALVYWRVAKRFGITQPAKSLYGSSSAPKNGIRSFKLNSNTSSTKPGAVPAYKPHTGPMPSARPAVRPQSSFISIDDDEYDFDETKGYSPTKSKAESEAEDEPPVPPYSEMGDIDLERGAVYPPSPSRAVARTSSSSTTEHAQGSVLHPHPNQSTESLRHGVAI